MYLCSSNLQLIVSLSLGELETILVKNIKKMKINIYILYIYDICTITIIIYYLNKFYPCTEYERFWKLIVE